MLVGVNFQGKLGLQQRVLPVYRRAFLERLADACTGGLSVFAGSALPVERIAPVEQLAHAQLVKAHNRYIMDPRSPLFTCWQSGLLRWLSAWQPDVLVVEANPRYPVTRFAIHWMHQRGRPVIGWGLGAPPLQGWMAWLRRWERLSLLRSLDGVIAYSQRGAAQYRRLGLPADRVFVASNAADPAPVTPPPSRPDRYLDRPVILFVGRLQARKRLDLLIHACARLPTRLQPRLVIVGDGPARTGFEALARRTYPLAEFVGERHGAQLEPFYQAADLFVLPGTGGLAVQQAMARALPVIVAQGDGTQDDLVRPGNGWQIPPDDQDALTVTILTALSNITRLRRMGAESFHIVAEEVNVETMVGVFVEAMKRVCVGNK